MGIIREKGRAYRIKYLCPKSKNIVVNGKTQYILSCDNPYTPSKYELFYAFFPCIN